MADSNLHYLFVVRAPGIGLNMLRSGAWAIMANDADLAQFDDRKTPATQALAQFRGQIVVFQISLDNPEETRVAWAVNTEKIPDLSLALTPTPEQRDIFWAYVAHYHQRLEAQVALADVAPGAPAHATTGVSLGGAGSLKWWLIGAAICLGVLAYAVFPEAFHHFNWQGKQYYYD